MLGQTRFSGIGDRDWYASHVPNFVCPDEQFNEIYRYRCEVIRRHICYANPRDGYIFTEFTSTEPLYWAGSHNAICCAAGLHSLEARWLRNPQYLKDYLGYWFRNDGAQVRNYSWSAAHAIWSLYEADGDASLACELLHSLMENFELWENGMVWYPHDRGYDPEMGLFWNTGRDSGGEFNLASAQLSEQLRLIGGYKIRGGAGYRPDSNADMYADAWFISKIADLAGAPAAARKYEAKARKLKKHIQEKLFDPDRSFFLHRWRYDEFSEADLAGQRSIKAGSLIWETNIDRHGGIGFQKDRTGEGAGRELSGYVPWFYSLPDDNPPGSPYCYAEAWKYLMDPQYFYAPFGPTTAERNDPWFSVIEGECRHNGQSWPFWTSKVLTAAANLLNRYKHHGGFTKEDYFSLLKIYTRSHYKNTAPHLAESHHPDEDRWVVDREIGRHYFHSSYIDLIVTGLMGLRPRDDAVLEIHPMIPHHWDYALLEDVPYHGSLVTIIYDRDGRKFNRGAGLSVFVDGALTGSSRILQRMVLPLHVKKPAGSNSVRVINYGVINCGQAFPKAAASYSAPGEPPELACNGHVWFDSQPVNQWTCRGLPGGQSWFSIDLGEDRLIDALRVYFYEDDEVRIPVRLDLQVYAEDSWKKLEVLYAQPETLEERRANTFHIKPQPVRMIRLLLAHQEGFACGIIECEVLRTVYPR